jgi:hypothetical protein
MITNNFPRSEIDQDAQRRRALAKVYSLLIRLAEEPENQPFLPDHISEGKEKIEEPTSIQADPSNMKV